MHNSTWTIKEKYLSFFFLLCGIGLVATIYIQKSQLNTGTVLQTIGLISFVLSWALSPQFFLQPLKTMFKSSITRPLSYGIYAFIGFQLAALVTRFTT